MPPARKPWPMRWIVIAIMVFVGLYTYLNLHFRKPGPAYLPYEDAQQRAGLARAGYHRISLKVDRPADPKPLVALASTAAAPGGLPADLRATLTDPLLLPAEIGKVEAAAAASAAVPYRIAFSWVETDNREDLAGAHVYIKGADVFVVPDCEHLAEGLTARARAGVAVVTLPSDSLVAGTYRVTLAAERTARSWTLQVH